MALRFKNLRQFNRELSAFGEKVVPEEHLAFQKRIALDLLRRIVLRTPVDTGRARGNWQTSLGPSANSQLDIFDVNGGGTISRGAAVIGGAQPFGLMTIFNNVDYIRFLENGSSQQAPSGMVSVSLQEVRTQFN